MPCWVEAEFWNLSICGKMVPFGWFLISINARWELPWIASSNRTIKYKCSNMFSKITVRLCHCTQWLKMIPVHIDGHLPSRSQHRLDFKRFYVDITAAYRYSMYIYMRMYIYILLHIYFYMYIYIHTFAVLDISLYPQIIQCHHIIPLYSHELLHNLHVMHDMSNSPPCLSYIIYIYCNVLHLHLIEVPFIFRFQARHCSSTCPFAEVESLPDALERSIESIVRVVRIPESLGLGPRRSEGNMTGH